LLALLLAVSMCMSLLPVQVFAAEAAEEEQYYEETEPAEVSEPAEAEPAESDPAATEPDEAAPETDAAEEEPAEEEPAEEAADAAAEEPGEEAEEENIPSEEESAEEVLVVEEAVALNAASGTSGSLEWSLDDSGNLTITGSGVMEDYEFGGAPWYDHCADIRTVTVGEGISTVGDCAFAECSSLTSLALPNGITSIGNNAFSTCSGLTSITLPSSVTSIGICAFGSCSSLTSITIPEGVTTISEIAFSGCSALAGITIPGSVTTIESNAFDHCTGLTSIVLPDSVTTIGEWAFGYCEGLTSVTVNSGAATIGSYAFFGCTGLASVSLPNGAAGIGREAFKGCTALADADGFVIVDGILFDYTGSVAIITIPTGVTSIGAGAFENKTQLTSVTIPSSVTSIGGEAFKGCTGLADADGFVIVRGIMFDYTGSAAEVTVPSGVTSLSAGIFFFCDYLESITLPESVTSISSSPFFMCMNLRHIYLLGSTISIEADTFEDLTATVHYSCGLKLTAAEKASCGGDCTWEVLHSGCTTVTVPATCTEGGSVTEVCACGEQKNPVETLEPLGHKVENGVCTRCGYTPDLASGTCGQNLTWRIDADGNLIITGSGAMRDFSNGSADWYGYRASVRSVTIEAGVTSIGNHAFEGCTAATSITLPDSVTSIGSSAFSGCSSVEEIAIPSGVTTIGTHAFEGCSGLTSIAVPAGVTSIADQTFSGCNGLTSVSLPNSITTIGTWAFEGCSGLTSLSLPESVTSIGDYAFYQCNGLKSITIPSGVKTIGSGAFKGCSGLTSVTVPDSVTSIGLAAFSGCSSLEAITIPFVGGSKKTTADDSYRYPLGYIFGADNYTGGVGTWQEYQSGATGTTSNYYYIPASLKSVTVTGGNILYGAFYGCSGLTSIILPESLESIGASAFYDCDGLTSITLPESLESIGASAFYRCSGLTSVTLPDGVTSIGTEAFYGCKQVESIILPASVTSVGENAAGEKTIQIYTGNMPEEFGTQSGVVLYPENATGWENLPTATASFAYNEENLILSGNCGSSVNYQLSTDRILRISGNGRMKNYSKTAPAPWASALKNGMVKSIVLEEGVTSVGSYAFVGNGRGYDWGYDSNLPIIKVSLTLPETIRTIGAYAFIELGVGDEQGRLTIPGSVSVIGEYAFAACGVQQLVLNAGLKSIGDCAFENCLLQEVILPDTVTTIGQWAFGGNKLTHVVVPSSVTTIDYGYSNTTLKSAGPIGSGCDYEFGWTDTIPRNAFSGCSGLTGIVLPDTIRKIGSEAFKGCSAIREIKLPDSLVSIGYGAFSGCSALEELTLPASLQTLGGYRTFYGCANLTSITLPEGITEIGEEMFMNCANLETVYIPSTVKFINAEAFSGCASLEQIDIPASVLHISDRAFEDCINLQRVDFNGDCPLTEEFTDDSGATFGYGPYKTGPFANVTADVYYPYRYSSWTAAMLQNYGGELTWIKKEVATSLTLQYSSAMVAGESQKLTYAFKPQGISGATVSWSLRDEDAAYASISSDGTLTAKNVTEIRTVTVTATPSVETVQPVSVKIKIYPQVEAKLYANGAEVSGTYYLDTEVTDSVEFTAEITPEGVCPGYQLSCDDWEGQYCTYTQTASGSLLLTPNSPQTNGTVEVFLWLDEPYYTSKVVEVRIVHYESELKPDNAPTLSAGAAMTLTASLLSKESGEALTNQPIVWTLVDGSAFATLSAKGVLKAKAVTETQTVTIRAESKNDAAAPVEFTVTILPRATTVRITDENGAAVTGKTLTWNLREEALETMTFSADTLPADAEKDVVWSCSDKKLAICIWNVDEDGNLIVEPAQTGKTGTVTFTATAADGSKKKATVKVSFVKTALPGELEFTVAPDTLKGKQTIALKTNIDALAAAEGLSAKKLIWSLGEGSEFFAAITSSGKLTVKPVGKEETIKVLAAVAGYPEIYAEKTITLLPAESGRTDEIRLFHEDRLVNNTNLVLDTLQGTELQLEAVAYPEGAGIVWKSSSSKIAAVDENGKVTALKAGTVVITATADDGSKVAASVKVTVRASVTGVSFTTPAGTVVTGGKKLSLSYAFAGEVKPTNTKVSFALAEQDAPYATISKAGVVSAAKVTGSHTVTVTITSAEDPKFNDTLQLRIQPAASAVEIRNAMGTVLTGTYNYRAAGYKWQLKAVTYPKDAADAVSWKSSAPAVATVDENGKVTFSGKAGKVKITATATDGSGKSATVTYVLK